MSLAQLGLEGLEGEFGPQVPQSISGISISTSKVNGRCPEEDREFLRGALVININNYTGITSGSAFALATQTTMVSQRHLL